MVLDACRRFSVICSFRSHGGIRCFKFKKSRQLWGLLVVSSNNENSLKTNDQVFG